MIAGRSLAFTGGTIDKLESIKNFQTQKDFDSFNKQIDQIGCGIISQSSEICPADKKLYSIRDLTELYRLFHLYKFYYEQKNCRGIRWPRNGCKGW